MTAVEVRELGSGVIDRRYKRARTGATAAVTRDYLRFLPDYSAIFGSKKALRT